MIPRSAITHWNQQVPWEDIANVEQDLIITRALYQRKKGRDLFDLAYALQNADVNPEEIIRCYRRYMSFVVDASPTYKQFMANMEDKMSDPEFTGDTTKLLRPEIIFDPVASWDLVRETLVERLKK